MECVMKTPGFTAEASLYRASSHYRTRGGSPALHSSAPTVRPIGPARRSEEIEVHGCLPGYTLWESGGEWGCSLVEPPTGGGDGGGPSGGGPTDGGGGGGPSVPAIEVGVCRPPNQPNPHYDPEICKACRE